MDSISINSGIFGQGVINLVLSNSGGFFVSVTVHRSSTHTTVLVRGGRSQHLLLSRTLRRFLGQHRFERHGGHPRSLTCPGKIVGLDLAGRIMGVSVTWGLILIIINGR